MSRSSSELFLAFPSGVLTYDCQPCGKCCRGYGLGGDLVRIGALPHVRRIGLKIFSHPLLLHPAAETESKTRQNFQPADGL